MIYLRLYEAEALAEGERIQINGTDSELCVGFGGVFEGGIDNCLMNINSLAANSIEICANFSASDFKWNEQKIEH